MKILFCLFFTIIYGFENIDKKIHLHKGRLLIIEEGFNESMEN